MPLYEYRCTRCGQRIERIEKVSGPHLKKCPKCRAKAERLVALPAIQFKGSGWYVTDYARKGAPAESKPAESDKGEKPKPATPEKKARKDS